MRLKILLPFEVFLERNDVLRIVVETQDGSFGFLPHRLDCASALSPGILVYETDLDGEVYVAVNEGVLVKTGQDVLVSVRQAFSGNNLSELRALIEQRFLSLNKQEQNIRAVMAKLETGFLRHFAGFQHD